MESEMNAHKNETELIAYLSALSLDKIAVNGFINDKNRIFAIHKTSDKYSNDYIELINPYINSTGNVSLTSDETAELNEFVRILLLKRRDKILKQLVATNLEISDLFAKKSDIKL